MCAHRHRLLASDLFSPTFMLQINIAILNTVILLQKLCGACRCIIIKISGPHNDCVKQNYEIQCFVPFLLYSQHIGIFHDSFRQVHQNL
jgi:hypothetical protein